jgi:uncharacterized protein (DUF342 family)
MASDISAEDGAKESIPGKEYKKLGYSLFVAISGDKLECRCSYVPRQQGSMMTRTELNGYLAASGVKEGLDEAALNTFAVNAAAGQPLRNVVTATGTPAVNGIDGRLSFTVQPSVPVQSDDDDKCDIDLHQVQTFINVMPGDEIACIVPPEPGAAGRGVTGEILQQQPGKPLALKIGKKVTAEDNGKRLVSAAAGRVCVVSGEISVEEEYVVAGDVNFRVGSIIFNGVVEVRGDVLDDFDINAAKGLRVSGNIGNCAITSDGDIALCGMDGQGKGTIVCGGSIKAQFIHDSIIECAGDLIVEVELHNCIVKTQGMVIVNKGAIAGGSYIALGGIETKKIGSLASVRTTLTVGVDYHDAEELESLMDELAKNHKQLGLTSTLKEIEELRRKRATLTDRIMAIRSKTDERANQKINIKGTLYDNTLLVIGSQNEEVREPLDGPLSVCENTIEGGLRYLSLTSLNVKATDIEKAFILEYQRK